MPKLIVLALNVSCAKTSTKLKSVKELEDINLRLVTTEILKSTCSPNMAYLVIPEVSSGSLLYFGFMLGQSVLCCRKSTCVIPFSKLGTSAHLAT